MQPNFSKNTSSLIRLTEEAKKKARHRLIGSIVLLLIALIILLNVTARVKPVPVNPENIIIKNNSSPVVKAQIPAKIISSNPIVDASGPISITPSVSQHIDTSKPIKTIKQDASSTISKALVKDIKFSPIVIANKSIARPSPEDILNGDIESKEISQYFVQLFATTDRARLLAAKQSLLKHKIRASTQVIKKGSGNLYRLRIGPFDTKEEADNEVSLLNDTQLTNNIESNN